jgi:hypothetical protein
MFQRADLAVDRRGPPPHSKPMVLILENPGFIDLTYREMAHIGKQRFKPVPISLETGCFLFLGLDP